MAAQFRMFFAGGTFQSRTIVSFFFIIIGGGVLFHSDGDLWPRWPKSGNGYISCLAFLLVAAEGFHAALCRATCRQKGTGKIKKRPPTITRRVEIVGPLLQVQGARRAAGRGVNKFLSFAAGVGCCSCCSRKRPEAHKTDDTAQQGTLFSQCTRRFCEIPVNIIANSSRGDR